MQKLVLLVSFVIVGCLSLFAQTSTTITGTITDNDGLPIPGAAVMVKGTTTGTVTDFDGKYSINVPAGAETLLFRLVGMEDQDQLIAGRSVIDVVMASDVEELDDIVVVAYGSATRGSLTGAVSQINSKDIEKSISTSATSALEGVAPGVQVNSTYGEPGKDPEIRIRGIGTVNGKADPLFVVDGVPFNGNITDLNSNDIESMTVLKDASSASLFGNRAANGVVLITTKRAKNDSKPVVTMYTNHGAFVRGIAEYERLDADKWMEIQWRGMKNYALSTESLGITDEAAASQYASEHLIGDLVKRNVYDAADDALFDADGKLIAKKKAGYDDTNWQDAVQKTGYRQEWGLSYTSSNERHNLYASFDYLNEEGYIITTGFERFSARVNSQITPTDWFKLGVNVYGTKQQQNYNSSANSTYYANPFYGTRRMAPVYPIYLHNEDGSYALDDNGEKQYDTVSDYLSNRNIVYELYADNERNNRYTVDGTVYGTFILPYGFEATVKANDNIRIRSYQSYNNPKIGDGAANNGRFKSGEYRFQTINFQQQINWSHEYDLSHVDALLAHESYSYKSRVISGMNTDMSLAGVYVMSNFTTNSNLDGYEEEDNTESYLGRLRYNYNDTYFLEASFRRDGSSRFSSDRRWGNFWSFGAAWDMTSEDFISNLGWFNYLKLRASYGQVGNNAGIDTYAYQALYEIGKNGGSAALYTKQLSANDLQWEANHTFDVALEGNLFGRFDFSVGYFNKISENLLFEVPLPSSAGSYIWGDYAYMTNFQNIGSLRNSGWELSADVDVIKGNGWLWKVGVDASFIKNKIEELPNHEDIQKGSYRRLSEGHALNDFYTYHFEGVDQMTGNSLYTLDEEQKADAEQAGKLVSINGKDYTTDVTYGKRDWAGSPFPKCYGSIHTDLSWKNISLSILSTYQIGGKVYDSSYADLMSTSASSANANHKDILKSWNGVPAGMTETSANRIKKNGIPVVNHNLTSYNNAGSDRWLIDASYLVMKNITLSYSLPKNWMDAIGVLDITVKGGVENAFTLTKRQGLNPQYSYSGAQDATYVTARIFNVGATIKF